MSTPGSPSPLRSLGVFYMHLNKRPFARRMISLPAKRRREFLPVTTNQSFNPPRAEQARKPSHNHNATPIAASNEISADDWGKATTPFAPLFTATATGAGCELGCALGCVLGCDSAPIVLGRGGRPNEPDALATMLEVADGGSPGTGVGAGAGAGSESGVP
jgi:hypothetical protein